MLAPMSGRGKWRGLRSNYTFRQWRLASNLQNSKFDCMNSRNGEMNDHWKCLRSRVKFNFSPNELDLIFSFLSTGYIQIGNNFNVTMRMDMHDHQQWIELVKYYWPILLVVLISALIIVLMPIVG